MTDGRRHAGPRASSPAPTRRTPRAGSTARTSPRPRSTADPRLDRLRSYYNHPGFLEPVVDAVVAARSRTGRTARLVFVTHSIPTSMNDGSGPRGGAYLAQHRERRGVRRRAGREGHRTRARPRPGLLLALRATAGALARAGRQRPPRAAGRRRGRVGRADPDRVRVRPHGGRLRPRHRGPGDRRPARARRRTGPDVGYRRAVRGDGARAAGRAGRRRARRPGRPGLRRR